MSSLPAADPSPSPAASPRDAPEGVSASQDSAVQSSDPDSSSFSFETSFLMEPGYPVARPENEKHPKGKRKRTTAQDKTVLEAAYNSNPKPDKLARLAIVRRVSLTEKEVQIWFQNRRQNDRRKSRPLSPQEIAALRYGGVPTIATEAPSFAGTASSSSSSNNNKSGSGANDGRHAADEGKRAPSPPTVGAMHLFRVSPAPGARSTGPAVPERRASDSGVTPPPPSSASFTFDANELAHPLSQSVPSTVGYLSNRWHALSTPSNLDRHRDDSALRSGTIYSVHTYLGARPADSFVRRDSFLRSATPTADNSPSSILPPPSTSSSQFRLSLSLEGKAELVSSQPSPPRASEPSSALEAATLAPVRAPRTLHRSRSALPGITLPPISTLTASLPPQLARGRSRDVQAWESCCDAETRDELTQQAENESSGSAIAAISLLRSSSQSGLNSLAHAATSALAGTSSKRNAPPSRRGSLTKKAKLSRTTSSVARMQSLPPPPTSAQQAADSMDKPERAATEEFDPDHRKKTSDEPALIPVLSPAGGDSDKENWSPEAGGNMAAGRRRHPLPLTAPSKTTTPTKASANMRRAGQVLGERNTNATKRSLLGSRASTAPTPRLRGGKTGLEHAVSVFEDENGKIKEGNGAGARKSALDKKGRDSDEVERFMRGEVSPSKRPDMDCVAGLLSLSQGNWR